MIDRYETPVITSEAKLFFILAGAITIGLSLLGKGTFSDAFGQTVTKAGIWTFWLGILLVMLPVAIWISRTIAIRQKGGKADFFPALILNKNFAHVNTQTVKANDPTSIEFGEAFRDLMKEIRAQNVRLIIVIDNIDRIDEDEAMQIWANARSFFLSSHDDNNLDSEPYHPTVVLPVDAQSISQMFAIGADEKHGDRIARSFINKTFDVTFDVPSPVMSDWKRYLFDRMKFCLGSIFSEERYFRTRQLLESWFASTDTPITPREINKSLNRIVALLMQWGDSEIAFESIVYYSINRERIGENIAVEIARQDHPLVGMTEDWAREIAAIYFGVSVELAAQVLMTEPIRNAILTYDPKLLQPYRKMAGFGDIFEQVTADLPADEQRPSPNLEVVTNAARLLAQEPEGGVWHTLAWKNLVGAFNSLEPGAAPGDLAERISPFFDGVESVDASDFVRTIERILDAIVSSEKLASAVMTDAAKVAHGAIEFARKMEVRLPIVDMTGDAARYLRRLAAIQDYSEVQKRLRTNASQKEVTDELVRRITDEEEAETVPLLLPFLSSDAAKLMFRAPFESLSEIVVAAEGAARNHEGGTQVFRSAVKSLAAKGGFLEPRLAALERLGQDGRFENQLGAVAGSGDAETIAIVLAILIWKQADIASPVGSSWSDFLEKYPTTPALVNRHLDGILDAQLPIEILSDCYESRYRNRILITAIMDERVRRGSLGRLSSEKVLGNLASYSRMMHWSLKDKFAKLLANYEKFWPNVKTMPWSESMFEAAVLLQKQGGAQGDRIKSELLEKVQKSSDAEWLAVVEKGTEPYQVATKVLDATDLKFGLNSPLTSVLVSSAPKASTENKAMRARWFELAELLSAPGRRKAIEAMGTAVLQAPAAEKIKILKAGGIRLLSEAGFDKRPDQAIDQLVLPLSRSAKGRELLRDRAAQVRPFMDAASKGAKGKVIQFLAESASSIDEDRKHWGEMMQRAWGLSA